MTDIDTAAIRARSARALSSFPINALRTPLHDQLRAALADIPALLDKVERQSRAATDVEAERDRLRAQVEAVRALVDAADGYAVMVHDLRIALGKDVDREELKKDGSE